MAFLLLSRLCLKKGQNQELQDCSCMLGVLKTKTLSFTPEGTGHDCQIGKCHNMMWLFLGSSQMLVAAGQFETLCVDIRDNTAYIYGKSGCQYGVRADQAF